MAKKSMIEREKKRQALVAQYAAKRAALKAQARDQSKPVEERFKATLKLAELPRNSSATRLHNRGYTTMQVVLGTTTPERVSGAAQGSDVALTRAEWYELFRAAGYRVP